MLILSVDKINTILLIFAATLAWLFPFELLLVAYAFLGPLHYLTEISWLHDRKYFTLRKQDPLLLTTLSLLFLFLGVAAMPAASELIWLLLLVAFCTAFIWSWKKRILVLVVGAVLLVPVFGSVPSYTMAIMIPTILHVFLFTLLFMVLGALRSKSVLGYYNAVAFFGLSILLLFLPVQAAVFQDFVTNYYGYFEGIARSLALTFSTDATATVIHLAAFLAFTYTYHYVNWFSKTTIIEWHKIPPLRAGCIGVVYAIAVGLYIIDYQLGLTALLTLSFLHVVLEFPLNFKSGYGIYHEIKNKQKIDT